MVSLRRGEARNRDDPILAHEKALNKRFPSVVEALASLGGDFVLDGELVALDPKADLPFSFCKQSIQGASGLFLRVRFIQPKWRAVGEFAYCTPARDAGKLAYCAQGSGALVPAIAGAIGRVLEAVRKLGLEGVVGKRIDSIYEPGERSGAWIKLRAKRGAGVRHRRLRPRGAEGSMRCSWAFTKTKNSSSSRK